MEKSADAFRTISEVSEMLDTPAHVLRFWESRFPQIRPVKRAGGRRYYRPSDVALLGGIKRLLHDDGLTIRGVQKVLREQGIRHVAGLAGAALVPPHPAMGVDDPPEAAPVPEAPVPAAAGRKPAAPRRPAVPRPDQTTEVQADPLPLWAAVVDRINGRAAAPQADASRPGKAEAAADEPAVWLPQLLRALPPDTVAEHRPLLDDIRTRLLALRNRVADAAHRPPR